MASLSDTDGRVGIDYGVYGVPETFVIDKEGVIRFKHIGPVTPEVLRDKILPLVKELECIGCSSLLLLALLLPAWPRRQEAPRRWPRTRCSRRE